METIEKLYYNKKDCQIALLTDSPLEFMKVCGLTSIIGTSPIKPGSQNQFHENHNLEI